ncbi:hypothetical protein HN873_016859, partial [Arachis hypogaea]
METLNKEIKDDPFLFDQEPLLSGSYMKKSAPVMVSEGANTMNVGRAVLARTEHMT